jgi:hypothetical protein
MLHLRHLRAETGEGLRQFATDRPAAEDDQPARQFAQVPHGVGGQVADRSMPGIGGTNGRAPVAMTMLRVAQPLRARHRGGDLDLPWRDDLRLPARHFDAEFGVALGRVVRFDGLDDPLHALHHVGESRTRPLPRMPNSCERHVREQLGRADQRLRRHAAGVQAVAADACFSTSVTLALTAAAM